MSVNFRGIVGFCAPISGTFIFRMTMAGFALNAEQGSLPNDFSNHDSWPRMETINFEMDSIEVS